MSYSGTGSYQITGFVLAISVFFIFINVSVVEAEGADEWNNRARNELRIALETDQIKTKPKNIIFFLGDGMGIATLTAARIYKGQREDRSGEEGSLVFERFPHVGLSKTYCDNKQTTDSAASATAFLCGIKTNSDVTGVNSNVQLGDFRAVPGNEVSSILSWAQKVNKATGIVTTTTVTHATPAAAYAHSASREWETDADMPENSRAFAKDIARQLMENETGRKLNVIMGGGRLNFLPNTTVDVPANETGKRQDGRDLLQQWRQNKAKTDGANGSFSQFITDRHQLMQLNATNTKNVLGLFSTSHMEYELLRNGSATTASQPSLRMMTRKAIEILQQYPEGFFLLVEGGRIDFAHHAGRAKLALHDTLEFDAAVDEALKLVSTKDTLLIVTADHSHTMGIAGYAQRGTSILKFGGMGDDKMPYLTLHYANGPGHIKQLPRRNLTAIDTEADDFRQDALVPIDYETHGGEDVAIYAKGPFAHLFHSLHEQNYIPHALDYAACYRDQSPDHCKNQKNSAAGIQFVVTNAAILLYFKFLL